MEPYEQPAGAGVIRVADAALNEIVPAGACIEKLASGFGFTEGPIWHPDGYLLFSDIPNNSIHKWTPDGCVSVFRNPSGFDGQGAPAGAFIGSNGLSLDPQGRVVVCEHGNRRVTRLEAGGTAAILADRYEGKRLNSPNDLVYKSDGSLYFTDPPYGLPLQDQDPAKELPFNGVYRLTDNGVHLLHSGLSRPNGLAFSPDEKYLYVSNSDRSRKIWMRFEVRPDGSLGEGSVFRDVTGETADGSPDGMKVDRRGNLYCTGPGGVWIFTAEGVHLGTIATPETAANLNWGDAGYGTLYITALTGLYRIRLSVEGNRPPQA